ncbi:protein phosphatase PTC7 [Marchantia polymorpha subsp. ruderalis]|nr:hypothetical protein MARPO_0071s0101 [Marchantia polymorpha]BBN11828.1 hypothetical protein Mp_5g15080 [Marchantia polymorpha subsp. ruderalis]|eukprot:PTQ35493.1 hypothetical protein MARPO_0071s0101 [Marchantia polymorpha]
MGFLDSFNARVPMSSCCSAGYPEEKKSNMALAPQMQGNVSPIGGARVNLGIATPSPARFPSAQFPTRPMSPGPAILSRPQSPGPSIKAILSPPGQTVVHQQRKELALAPGVKVIPHPEKVAKGGEDAYFTSNYKGGVLGVADGVSGWAAENVDPALFSKEFMAHAAAAVGTEDVNDDPRLLLAKAHRATCSIGAATAIVAILDERGTLHVANLGDCGLRLIRNGKVVYATAPQQHYFDCPYQFSSENAQTADDAAIYDLDLLEGDTIVMGSDGLFDNVYDSDIESTVKVFSGSDEDSANRLAMALATLASKHARDRNYNSPYAVEAVSQGHDVPWYSKIFGKKMTGGKLDDITVVVGHVVSMPVADKAEVKAEEVPSAQDEQGEKVEKVAETETFTGFQQPEAKGEQVGDLLTNGINAKTEEPLP